MFPTEIIPYTYTAAQVKVILDKRYNSWWILERIIECQNAYVYYFRNVEPVEAIAV